jgi:hypothetical protein
MIHDEDVCPVGFIDPILYCIVATQVGYLVYLVE